MVERTLSIDIETYSSVDLIKSGVYAYTEAPDFEILLFAYSFDEDPVQIVDFAQGEKLSKQVLEALTDPQVTKTAFNANFERTCLAKYFSTPMPPEQWECSSVHALTLGLPNNLGGVAKALKLQVQKDAAGKVLIRYFSIPCKPTKANGGRTRNLPEHDLEKWENFKAYCIRDVEVEKEIKDKLKNFPVPKQEWKLWQLDQKINDTGVLVDSDMVGNAITCDLLNQERITQDAVDLTGLDNPKSVSQLKEWLSETAGIEVESLNKKAIPELLKQTTDEDVIQVLELRQAMSKTSVKKYEAIKRSVGKDLRVRGLFQFYGANRTGRWAGRLVQVQNLPQNKIIDLDLARELLKSGNYDAMGLLFESVPGILSQLIRTAFIPSPGNRFIVADFSAIEARVIAWLAEEKWRLDVFQTHGKIYEASASQMFNVPIESITKGNPLRQKGKVAELALGYQGAQGALVQMGALDMGLMEEELPGLVKTWRNSNQKIVQLWGDVERAAIEAVKNKTTVKLHHHITFSYEAGMLFIKLPSGRRLAYVKPRIEKEEKFNKDSITYEGLEQGKWSRLKTYGGKLVENIVQAIARDCLAESMLKLAFEGYQIVMHVHDEVILDVPKTLDVMDEVVDIMGQPISWAPGLPLRADAYETDYYKKD